jgi:hypothetical protein
MGGRDPDGAAESHRAGGRAVNGMAIMAPALCVVSVVGAGLTLWYIWSICVSRKPGAATGKSDFCRYLLVGLISVVGAGLMLWYTVRAIVHMNGQSRIRKRPSSHDAGEDCPQAIR